MGFVFFLFNRNRSEITKYDERKEPHKRALRRAGHALQGRVQPAAGQKRRR